MVTHDEALAKCARRVVTMRDGEVVADTAQEVLQEKAKGGDPGEAGRLRTHGRLLFGRGAGPELPDHASALLSAWPQSRAWPRSAPARDPR